MGQTRNSHFNNIQDGDETGVDCGGSTGAPCFNGAAVKAFDDAQGFGRYATGGRTGTVYKVTNLNESGAGSLNDALSVSNRIIVFQTGGVIPSDNEAWANSDFTIIGHSSPSDSGGITIEGNVTMDFNNAIGSHISFRLGDDGYKDAQGNILIPDPVASDRDALAVSGDAGGGNIMLYHLSISGGIDENFSMDGSASNTLYNVTIQNSLISYGLGNSHHSEGFHSMGSLIYFDTQDFTYYRNYFPHSNSRWPRVRGGGTSFEFLNNIAYGYGSASVIGAGAVFNEQGNYFKENPNNPIAAFMNTIVDFTSETGYDINDSRPFISGNGWDIPSDLTITEYDSQYDAVMELSPAIDSSSPIITYTEAITEVLSDVGNVWPFLQQIDQDVIDDFNNGTGDIIDSQSELGGWPTIATGTPWPDTDDDGMNDDLEVSFFGDLSQDAMTIAANGRTNIENLYNSLIENTPGKKINPNRTSIGGKRIRIKTN